MLKETLDLLRIIEKQIPIKSHIAAYPREEGLQIRISVNLNGRPYDFNRIFSDIEIYDFQGSDEDLAKHMCEEFKWRVRNETKQT